MASRRHDDPSHKMINKLHSALDRLRHVWDEIGLDSVQQSARTDVVFVHLDNLLDEMVAEEEGLRDRLLKNIKKYGIELLRLSKELCVPPYEPPEGLTNIQLEKDLKKKVESWEKERRDRVALLAKLQEEEQHLCDVMCTTPLYISSGSVPKQAQLDELRDHIRGLKSEKEKRQNLFVSMKKNIVKMLEDLEQCPNTSFERDLLCEEDDSFLLTNDNMAALRRYSEELRDQLETLWERLQLNIDERMEFRTRTTGFKPKVIEEIKQEIARCQEMKRDKIQQVIENTRHELVDWWDRCYVDEAEREKFMPFTDDNYTETCLLRHEEEVDRLRGYFEKNKDMLELVGKWRKLFNRFLEDEKRASDPNRYFNRGCNLLKEEKARKKIQKELPRVQEEVTAKIKDWEKSVGRRFLVNGKPFTEYIEESWENFRDEKERKKAERLQAKARLIEEELKYGSHPAHTPGKKRALGLTPGKTPTKRCRLEKGTSSTLSSASGTSTYSEPSHKQINDTTKTPTSYVAGISRSVRTNHTSVFSPVCMAPRSTNKSKTPGGTTTGIFASRIALAEKNPPTGNDTGFSQTTRGLSQNSRPNCRSSVLPSSLKPAYF
ncbi:hypothetical protein LSH36_519g02045 [Paralvinella palmiformis]|uniref:Protein regulator of cytokinesis 1 n=1 Tax=Paralvinella palmiformis TaxID=53620 RepID=A0AAD9J991_9ANNE|nr:hypothetical protein LSH36_519g02045 [Paralvinella palmiformis]